MMNYNREPSRVLNASGRNIPVFESGRNSNIDQKTVDSFADEWNRFHDFDAEEIIRCGDEYFDITDGLSVNKDSIVLDIGCGSGRWSWYLAPKVKFIEATDPSDAVIAAAELLKNINNVRITKAALDELPFEDNSFDLVFSLGVLHHIPDTAAAVKTASRKVKKGGYLLLYLYYRFDNRNFLFRLLFNISNLFRLVISKMPCKLKQLTCDVIAAVVYVPIVTIARMIRFFGGTKAYLKIPLSYYADKSFYIMRNDALDRFGTPLEQRFTKAEIHEMLIASGLNNITFSENAPYWHVIAQKPLN